MRRQTTVGPRCRQTQFRLSPPSTTSSMPVNVASLIGSEEQRGISYVPGIPHVAHRALLVAPTYQLVRAAAVRGDDLGGVHQFPSPARPSLRQRPALPCPSASRPSLSSRSGWCWRVWVEQLCVAQIRPQRRGNGILQEPRVDLGLLDITRPREDGCNGRMGERKLERSC